MKKTMFLLLCAVLALFTAACGADTAPAATEAPLPTEEASPAEAAEAAAPPMSEDEPAEDENASPTEAEEAPASPSDVDEEVLAAARACIGQPAEALFAAVGEPGDAQYAASCLEEGAEDGMLYYDGFTVWTVRTETEELVHDVYLMD